MKFNYKIITGVAAAMSLAAAGVVYAQQGSGMGGYGPGYGMGGMGYGMAGAMGGGMGYGMAGGMFGIDGGAIADLKAELKITPAQEATWLAFENLTKQQSAAMLALGSQMHNPQPGATSADFAATRNAMMALRDANQAARETALKDLYAVLTPEQKAVADQRLNAMGGHRTAHNHWAN
ncbi:MAG: Spy/CpxP family protein refolding chaperone [Polaromonas sp.]|nr:Spy/CpxP family protein refolding chaperone [Polaromonas sp.]